MECNYECLKGRRIGCLGLARWNWLLQCLLLAIGTPFCGEGAKAFFAGGEKYA